MLETTGTNQTELDNTVKEISSISTVSGINTGISKQAKKSGNSQKINKVNKPWFDQECRERMRQYKRIKERLRKSKSYSDREVLKTEYKLYKNFINRKRNIYNKNLHKELRNLKSSKPKEYWKLLNPKKNKPNNSLSANAAYNHFKLINEFPITEENEPVAPTISNEGDEILNNDFTPIEINKLINKLKNNKSCGIDNVTNEFIKHSPDSYKSLLTKLFNVVLTTGIIPSDFKNKGYIAYRLLVA